MQKAFGMGVVAIIMGSFVYLCLLFASCGSDAFSACHACEEKCNDQGLSAACDPNSSSTEDCLCFQN